MTVSLRVPPPPSPSRPASAAGVALLIALGLAAVGADLRSLLSPGVLSKGHDDFGGNCDACHLVFDGVPDGKCLKCHEAVAARISQQDGFHAKHADARCSSCHPDHRGYDFQGTTDEALAAFDHAETGFALRNGHATQTCAECHDVAPLEKLGVGCSGCHADPHSSALGLECGACHVDTAFDAQLKGLADHHLDTSGGHQGLGCADCHRQGEHLEPLVACSQCHAQAHDGTATDCASCHQVAGWKPAEFNHGPCTCAFPGKHQTVACLSCHADFDFTDTPLVCEGCHEDDRKHEPLGGCARCHTATSWTEGEFDHDRAKFKVDGAHLGVSCTQCHPTEGVFRGAPTDCAGCHREAGDRAHGDFGACDRCHTVAAFSPSTFDHASTGFALTGTHLGTACQACHAEKVRGYPGPR